MVKNNDDASLLQSSKRGLDRLKTRPFERNLALTKLGFGAGSKIVAHGIRNMFRGEIERDEANRGFYERQARVLADELGQLKGSVMKAGQMLSLWGQYFLPEKRSTCWRACRTTPRRWPGSTSPRPSRRNSVAPGCVNSKSTNSRSPPLR